LLPLRADLRSKIELDRWRDRRGVLLDLCLRSSATWRNRRRAHPSTRSCCSSLAGRLLIAGRWLSRRRRRLTTTRARRTNAERNPGRLPQDLENEIFAIVLVTNDAWSRCREPLNVVLRKKLADSLEDGRPANRSTRDRTANVTIHGVPLLVGSKEHAIGTGLFELRKERGELGHGECQDTRLCPAFCVISRILQTHTTSVWAFPSAMLSRQKRFGFWVLASRLMRGLLTAPLSLAPLFLGVGMLASCASSSSAPSPPQDRTGSLTQALEASALDAQVPRDLLLAIAKVEDGLTFPRERPIDSIDVDTDVPAAGPLQLRRGKLDTLKRGAELTNATELDLRMHGDHALLAGARVLHELAEQTKANANDLATWSAAIEEMSGFADQPHRESYAHQVFATLARGGTFTARDGETVVLAPHPELPPTLTLDIRDRLKILAPPAQYDSAEWIPTSCNRKCTEGRATFKVELILIHDTEGNWNASVATLQNDPNKSVQYIIDVDGRVGQFVTEETTAWHAGNFNVNQRSVGIEHVGYAAKPFPEALYASSAKLTEHLANKYQVPKDRAHIIGHDQVPNGNRIAQTSPPCSKSPKECQADRNYGGASNHSDPGIWEWAPFMARFGGTAKCNDVTNLWACSNDKTKAFRCASDKVEVSTCDGQGACEAAADPTKDAVCHIATKSEPPPPPPPVVAPEPPPPPPADEGCNTSRSAPSGSGFVVLGLALVAISRLKRKPKA
jgi:N-acetyl-anhydromuramyl-L-alanine amidase AmpD